MIYTPALPRPAVRLMVIESVIILCLFATAPVFVASAWPAPALALGLLIILRSNWPPEPLAVLALLAALAALLGAAFNGILAAGMIWQMAILLLLVGSLQRAEREPALFAIVTAAAIHAVYGPISTVGPRLAGWLGNPNVYGSFMAICLPLAVAGRQWLFATAIAGGLILSGSVGAWIGAAAGLVVLYRNRRLTLALGTSVLPALIVSGIALGKTGWRWRPGQWLVAIHQAVVYPLAGSGPGSYAAAWAGLAARSPAIPTSPAGMLMGYWPSFSHAHNLYLHVLGELGILGIVALAGVFVYVAYNVRGPALAGLAALAVHGLVDATALHPVIAVLAAMLIGIGSPRETRPTGGSVLVGLLLMALSPVAGELLVRLLYGAPTP